MDTASPPPVPPASSSAPPTTTPSSRGKTGVVAYGVVAALLLGCAALTYVLVGNLRKQNEVTQTTVQPELSPTKPEGISPTPESLPTPFYYQLKSKGDPPTKTPWLTGSTNNRPPKEPTIPELDSVYRKYRTAVNRRDYDAFSALASARLKFILDVNSTFAGNTKDGLSVAVTGSPRGREYFMRYGPFRLARAVPVTTDEITAVLMKKTSFPRDPTSDYILVDKDTNEEIRVTEEEQSLVYEVAYALKDPGKYQLTEIDSTSRFGKRGIHGFVQFVYESGSWRIFMDDWSYVSQRAGSAVGDVGQSGEEMIIAPTSDGTFSSLDVTIEAGNKIRWRNVSGVILTTIDTPMDQWVSPALLKQDYVKRLTVKGKYRYAIVTTVRTPPELTGVITVE